MSAVDQKLILKRQYMKAVQEIVDSKEPHAIVLVENPGVSGGAELSIRSFSLQPYIADHGHDEAVLHALEEKASLGFRTWLVDCVGGQFSEEKEAFEAAWEEREWHYELRGIPVPA